MLARGTPPHHYEVVSIKVGVAIYRGCVLAQLTALEAVQERVLEVAGCPNNMPGTHKPFGRFDLELLAILGDPNHVDAFPHW